MIRIIFIDVVLIHEIMPVTNTDELIVYSNSRNGLGIRILGTRRVTNKSGVYIKQLLDHGLAQRDGRLKVNLFSKEIILFLFLDW